MRILHHALNIVSIVARTIVGLWTKERPRNGIFPLEIGGESQNKKLIWLSPPISRAKYSLRSSRFLSFPKRSRTGGELRKSGKISSRGRG